MQQRQPRRHISGDLQRAPQRHRLRGGAAAAGAALLGTVGPGRAAAPGAVDQV
jgi:hypothetical protein